MPRTIKVFGPPGTGKTTTSISMLKDDLASGKQATRVGFITHTKAACEEVKKRVTEHLSLTSDDLKWFRTIHSMCCGMEKIGFNDIMSRHDEKKFHKDTGFYIKGGFDLEALEEFKVEDEGYDIVRFADQLAKAQMISLEDVIRELPLSPKLRDPMRFLEAYAEWKKENGKLDYTDMLTTYLANGSPGNLDVVYVDEAQDLSKLQWEIVKLYSRDAEKLVLAGDDDQSIYRFLGADEFGFLDFPADEEVMLTKSHRCPKAVGEMADKMIQKISRRKDKVVEWSPRQGSVRTYALNPNFLPWQEWSQGTDTVMVLTRHRRQMYEVRNMLDDMSIPHTLGGKSMATSHLGHMIRVYLELREGTMKFRPALVGKMLEAISERGKAREVRDLGVHDKAIMVDKSVADIDWDTKSWPSLFSTKRWEVRQIETLRKQINKFGLGVITKTLPRIDISTYHGSKGRQAHQVILYTDCYPATWEEQQENPDSEIRLAYVGLTRSQKNAIIILPRTAMYLLAFA